MEPIQKKMLSVVLPLTLPALKLLAKYHAICVYDASSRGLLVPQYTRVLAAILTRFATEKAPEIEKRFNEIQADICKRGIPRCFSADQLTAIADASETDFPEVLRVDWRAREAKLPKHQRAILRPVGQPGGSAARLFGFPRQVSS